MAFSTIWACRPQQCANPCPSPINIRDQVLLLPPDQCPSPLAPNWQGSFKVILVAPTAAKFESLPHWMSLSQLKLFTPSPQDNLSSYSDSNRALSPYIPKDTEINCFVSKSRRIKSHPITVIDSIWLGTPCFPSWPPLHIPLSLPNTPCFINFPSVSLMTYSNF